MILCLLNILTQSYPIDLKRHRHNLPMVPFFSETEIIKFVQGVAKICSFEVKMSFSSVLPVPSKGVREDAKDQ